MAERRVDRWLRPRVVLPVLALALLLAALLTPVNEDDGSPQFLTTRSRTMNGARGLRDLYARLGWKTSERIIPFSASLDSAAVYLVLGTPIDPSATEIHALLENVRRGGRAILVPDPGTPMADSIGIQASQRIVYSLYPTEDSDSLLGAGDPVDTLREAFGVSGARAFHRYLKAVPKSDSDSVGVWPSAATTLFSVLTPRKRALPEIALLPVGRGTIMAIADPNFLRNDVLKKSAGAVLAVRMVERIDSTGRAPLIFDEFHQGFGRSESSTDVLVEALTETPWGRAGLQVALAALLYLIVVGVRPIAPVSRARLERRSPLEHVGALSRAYEAIDATQLVVQRLVRGLRRRHPLGAIAQLSDAGYLALLRVRLPALGGDIDILTHALAHKPTAEGLVSAGAAIDHIERNLIT
jgi:hypothetical protein